MKKALSILLTAAVLLTTLAVFPLSAGAKTSGKYEYEVRKDGTVRIVYYRNKKSEKTIKFPSKIKGKKVTSISGNGSPFGNGGNVFENREYVKKIIIPKNVKELTDCAFMGCTKLKSVKISSTVKVIGLGAFDQCTSLTNVKLPNSVTLLENAFSGCTKLKSITLSKKLKRIGWSSFYDCKSLKSIVIPDSVKELGDIKNEMDSADFCGCTNLKSVVIGKKVKVIGIGCFWNCKKLKSIVIPPNVKKIGKKALGFTNYGKKKVKGFIIKGKKNSAAHKYAKKHKFKFVRIF